VWILVVEDEISMGGLLRQGLEEQNHTVTLARDGLEGIHEAETCDFAAIVLDVMMPGMDGVEVARRLRAAGRAKQNRLSHAACDMIKPRLIERCCWGDQP
jgi:DNA-binding response OmpR family regulator